MDLNFDGKDDIAVKFDSGGNGRPFYSFYIQNMSKKFELNAFLKPIGLLFQHLLTSKIKY